MKSSLSSRAIEIIVGLILLVVAAVVIYDSRRIGASWAADGPQAGYFPFYIGVILALASAWIVLSNLRTAGSDAFVGKEEFKRVLAVLIPAALYVAAIYIIGIYAASALFIAFFMHWHGKFRARTTLVVSLIIPLALFFLFEVWFLVPLPKGPLENLLGY
ncbi:MAG: tripartite tricarboxylate transporter TctB family protein [Burkholderiales bacterium]